MWIGVLFVALVLAGACSDPASDPPADAPAGAAELIATDSGGQRVPTVTFGVTSVGQRAAAQIKIVNKGNVTSGLLAVTIAGPAANDFGLDNTVTTCAGASLEPAGTCVIGVTFEPSASGDRSATLSVLNSDGGSITVALFGPGATPSIRFVPALLDFGLLETGVSLQSTLQVVNDGALPAPIDSISIADTAYVRGVSTCGTSLPAGGGCDIAIRFAPTDVALHNASLIVTSGGTGYAAALYGDSARRLTVTKNGTGAAMGTVTSDVPGIACGATCSALFKTNVVLTATAASGTAFTGWSLASCGTSPTCTVPIGASAATVTAGFALQGGGTLQVNYTGDATIDIAVHRQYGAAKITSCSGSCSIPIDPGTHIQVTAASPSDMGTVTSPLCTAPIYPTACMFAMPAGTAVVNVTATKAPGETWTRLVFPGQRILFVKHDSAGNIIAASREYITKISSAGITLWTANRNVSSFDIGPADTIYIRSGTSLTKLDANGAVLWTVAFDQTLTNGGPMVVAPDGSIVLFSKEPSVVCPQCFTGLHRWDANGVPIWVKPDEGGNYFIGSAGIIYMGRKTGTWEEPQYHVRRIMLDGTELAELVNVGGGLIALDSDGHLFTGGGGGAGTARLARLTPVGTLEYALTESSAPGMNSNPNGVSTGTGRFAWWRYTSQWTAVDNYKVTVHTNAGSPVWSVERRGQKVEGPNYSDNLVGPTAAAVSFGPTGQLVVGGTFFPASEMYITSDTDIVPIGYLTAFQP